MRISSLLRAFEDVAISVGSKVAVATKEFAEDVSKEATVRAQYKHETSAVRRARLDELRAIVEAQERAVVRASRKPAVKSRKRVA